MNCVTREERFEGRFFKRITAHRWWCRKISKEKWFPNDITQNYTSTLIIFVIKKSSSARLPCRLNYHLIEIERLTTLNSLVCRLYCYAMLTAGYSSIHQFIVQMNTQFSYYQWARRRRNDEYHEYKTINIKESHRNIRRRFLGRGNYSLPKYLVEHFYVCFVCFTFLL